MNNYVEQLSDDDMLYFCQFLGGRVLRELFKRNNKAFNRIRPGFRPGSLSDDETFGFVISNKKEGFVASFFNAWIADCLKNITKLLDAQVKSRSGESLALAEVLANSLFDKKPELYFKLTGLEPPLENKDFFYSYINLARNNSPEKTDMYVEGESHGITAETLSELEEEYKTRIDSIQEEHEKALLEIKEETKRFKETINKLETEARSQKEQNQALQKELDGYKQLESFEVPHQAFAIPEEYMFASLCQVYTDERGQNRLHRMADVRDGELSQLFASDAPAYSNLFRVEGDGPDVEGSIGIWDWKTVPNKTDPTKDFIITAYDSLSRPIEFVINEECTSIFELSAKLRDGIVLNHHSDRIVIAVSIGEVYEGIYCDKENSVFHSGKIAIKPDIIKVPAFNIKRNDYIRFEDIMVISKLGLGIPSKLLRIKDPIEIVQKLIVDRATWPVMQRGGFIRNEYRQVKEFLAGLPTEDLFDEICHICDCSVEESRAYVDDFIARSDEFASGNTLENSILAQIIRNDPALYSACLVELGVDWEEANREKVQMAKNELLSIQRDEEESIKRCDEKEKHLLLLEGKIEEAEQRIVTQKQMADDVEKLVNLKIEHARANVAEFIAENAFIHSDRDTNTTKEDFQLAKEQLTDIERFTESGDLALDNPDINDNYEQVLQTLGSELLEAGVSASSAAGLSIILYSAFINRISLLLAGPNGVDIACAFYSAIKCMRPAILSCEGEYSHQDIKRCLTSSDDLVVIEMPFQAEWQNAIIKMISKHDRMYILVHPYAEDLCIEPRGLFNYCVPLLTELFVDTFPSGQYVGGKCSPNYKHYTSQVKKGLYDKLFSAMNVNSLLKRNCQMLLSDVSNLSRADGVDMDYELLLYPLAYVLGETEELSQYIINADHKPSAAFRAKLKKLIGDNE